MPVRLVKQRSSAMQDQRSRVSRSEGTAKTFHKDVYRLVVMGAAGVGKTCIISQFMYDTFLDKYKATVEELHRDEFEVQGRTLTLELLDTAGSFAFPAMRKLSIATGDAFILVYSVADEGSFDAVQDLRDQILAEKCDDKTPIVIVGNKTDLGQEQRAIVKETAESTANLEWDSGYVEVSAKDNINIGAIFRELLVQARIQENTTESPAMAPIPKRRHSTPILLSTPKRERRRFAKRNSCTMS